MLSHFLKNEHYAPAFEKGMEDHMKEIEAIANNIDSPTFENTIIAIDSINDPGNLGTIIRLCDWFGIKNIICSKDSVECFNPKVIQATMGSIARVNCLYLDLGL